MARLIGLLFLFLFLKPICGESLPYDSYITGERFRLYCDYVFDEGNWFRPQSVKEGDCIFVKTHLLGKFFQNFHPYISCRYILLTHISDTPIPGPFASYLEQDKIIAWFGINIENFAHPKLHALPIGLERRYPKNIQLLNKVRDETAGCDKTQLLYMNFKISNRPRERLYLFNLLSDKSFCQAVMRPKKLGEFFSDLAHSKFVLSPRGAGLDCYRTYEALYMGTYPIVISSSIDYIFEDLPVLIIRDWEEITEEFLNEKYMELSRRTDYKWEKLTTEYWYQYIDSYRGR